MYALCAITSRPTVVTGFLRSFNRTRAWTLTGTGQGQGLGLRLRQGQEQGQEHLRVALSHSMMFMNPLQHYTALTMAHNLLDTCYRMNMVL